VIIWLNGTFGCGKTSTAAELHSLVPSSRVFDPETVGYMLQPNLADQPVADFRHWPPWRPLVVATATELARFTGQHLIAPQTILVRAVRLWSAWQQCSRLLFELDLIAQRDLVGAHRREVRLEAGTAAVSSTAMHPHQAEAAALVEAQRVNVVVGGNDPQAATIITRADHVHIGSIHQSGLPSSQQANPSRVAQMTRKITYITCRSGCSPEARRCINIQPGH